MDRELERTDAEWLRIISREILGPKLDDDHWTRTLPESQAAWRAVQGAMLFGMAGLDDRCLRWFQSTEARTASVTFRVKALVKYKFFRGDLFLLRDSRKTILNLSDARSVRFPLAIARAWRSPDWFSIMPSPRGEPFRDLPFCVAYMRCLAARYQMAELKTFVEGLLEHLPGRIPAVICRELVLILPVVGFRKEATILDDHLRLVAPLSTIAILSLVRSQLLLDQPDSAMATLDSVSSPESPSLVLKARSLRVLASAHKTGHRLAAYDALQELVRRDPTDHNLQVEMDKATKPFSWKRLRASFELGPAMWHDSRIWSGLLDQWKDELM